MNKKCGCGSKGKKGGGKVKVPAVKAPKTNAPPKRVLKSGEASVLGRVMYQF